jgi:hypothetical protein
MVQESNRVEREKARASGTLWKRGRGHNATTDTNEVGEEAEERAPTLERPPGKGTAKGRKRGRPSGMPLSSTEGRDVNVHPREGREVSDCYRYSITIRQGMEN